MFPRTANPRWQNFLLEGKLEQQTTQLSRAVVQVLKQMLAVDAINDEETVSYTFKADEVLSPPIEWLNEIDLFSVAQIMGDYPEPPPPAVHGTYAREEEPEFSYLEIYVYFPPEPEIKHLGQIVPKLKETIRHELQHAVQSRETLVAIGGVPDFDDLSNVKRIYLSDGEVSAWVAGLYKRAKMQKVPLSEIIAEGLQLLEERLKDRLQPHFYTEIENFLKQLEERWLQYARERYPRAK